MFSINRMAQVLKSLPRGSLDRSVREHRADRHCKGFTSLDQLLVMVYAQLSGAHSLRQLEASFNTHRNHHYHLGTGPVRRSTLADANQRRTPEVFAEVAQSLMQQAGRSVRAQRDEMLYLLDSTSITLQGRGFDDWTRGNRTRRTQGIKVHMLLEHSTHAPLHASVSAPNVNDIEVARQLHIEPGATYVFDKGYCDYNWWHALNQAKARWVTRFKNNAALQTLQDLPIAQPDQQHVLQDSLVRFTRLSPRGRHRNTYTEPLRRIVIARPDKATPLVLATNDMHSSAAQIAQLYKERWQIELFFKWIKQNLQIKRFLGQSQNAVRIQVYTALITYLLLMMYRTSTGATQSLHMVLAELRTALFERPAVHDSQWRKRRERQAYIDQHQRHLFT